MSRCICDWPATCGGSGVLTCRHCGGDFCVCRCGGESECYGCADCEDPVYDDDGVPESADGRKEGTPHGK
jgi:hypothetical protein